MAPSALSEIQSSQKQSDGVGDGDGAEKSRASRSNGRPGAFASVMLIEQVLRCPLRGHLCGLRMELSYGR